MKRCYGCFQSIADESDRCPFCGFSLRNYEVHKWALMPGILLNGKYLVGRTLGEGGFGITYLAWDTNMETRVAIKEYYPGNLVSRDVTSDSGNSLTTTTFENKNNFEDGLKRYVKEAAVLAKFFELPGIVSVKDFFYENGTAYIVMEFIDGISLKKVLEQKGGRLTSDEALNLIKPVISSLAIIHKSKILHRDISPDNIMIDKNGRVKLIDFGAARYFEGQNDKSMTVMLKHGYAPVEQYSRSGEQGSYTDVYGLCAVLYRMITGSIPIEATERIRDDKLIPVRKLARKTPKYVAAAIEKGLSVLPENRQQSMEELYAEFYISLKGRAAKRVDKLYRILRKMLIMLIVCLSLVAIGGIIYRVNRDKINDFSNRVQEVFREEEDVAGSDDADEEMPISDMISKKEAETKSETAVDIRTEEETEQKIETETEKKTSQETSSSSFDNEQEILPNTGFAESTSSENEIDPMVEHGIVVARDGVLNGHDQSLSVGNILDTYSDRTGNWDGYIDENGNVYIYYQGSKDGESFVIEFQVFSDDTFKVTGAAKDGERLETYSDFFQQILNEVGI